MIVVAIDAAPIPATLLMPNISDILLPNPVIERYNFWIRTIRTNAGISRIRPETTVSLICLMNFCMVYELERKVGNCV